MIAAMDLTEATFWIAACAVAVYMTGVFSGLEIGLYCLNRLRLGVQAAHRLPAALTLQRLLVDQPGLLLTTLLGTNVGIYFTSSCVAIALLKWGASEHRAEFYTSLVLTPVVLVFGEILPKVLFERHADRLLLRYSAVLSAGYTLVRRTGLIALQNALSRFILRKFHRQAPSGSALHSRLEMYHLLRESAAQGALSRTQLFMLERIHTLQKIRVGSVMVPLGQVVMLPDTAQSKDAVSVIRNCPYSRLPVFQGRRNRLIGQVHVLDVLTAPPDDSITRRLYPPVEVRYDADVIETLTVLQKKHRRMAFVIDEIGRCLGVVTVKDLVEEIVGELTAW